MNDKFNFSIVSCVDDGVRDSVGSLIKSYAAAGLCCDDIVDMLDKSSFGFEMYLDFDCTDSCDFGYFIFDKLSSEVFNHAYSDYCERKIRSFVRGILFDNGYLV